MHTFLIMLLVPVVAGTLAYLINRLRNDFSFIGAIVTLYYAIRVFLQSRHGVITYDLFQAGGVPVGFRLDALSGFIILCVAVMAVLVLLFSLRYMRGREYSRAYYFFILLGLACSIGVLLAANLIVMLFFWSVLLIVLYGLLLGGGQGSERVAAKALVIVGLSDFAMLLGIALVAARLGWFDMTPPTPMPLRDPAAIAGFLLIATGALAKAGSMPFHSWIPAAGETAPATVMAYMPASLDKLLGIYLLTRVSVYVFDISSNVVVRDVLMTVGAFTILCGVMMALVQKRVSKLLAFHAVSQVGYMVMGIGTGIPVGIAGGLFHMLNNSIYKTSLFLCGGSVEHWAHTDEIDKLGGLARQMPLTFGSFLVAALAIAGVPPLNGFVSKWMVYQGIISLAGQGNRLYPVFLVAAMLGSVLTLASFLKLLHSIFLGQRPDSLAKTREVGFGMWLPPVLLGLACVVFGVFAYQIPLRGLIYPALPFPVELPGIWQPALATLLLLTSLGVGALIYIFGTGSKPVPARTFVGGEKIADLEESRATGSVFYSAVKNLGFLHRLYAAADAGATDLYNLGLRAVEGVSQIAFTYVDRTVDAFYSVARDIIVTLGRGFRAVGIWFFALLLIPLLVYVSTGQLLALRYLAVGLMVGGALMALVEVSFPRFMLLISLTQIGFVVLAMSRGGAIGFLSGLFQLYNSLSAYAAVFLAYRLVMVSARPGPGKLIADYRGVSQGMPVATLGFVVGGLALAGMPPSGNFFSKYLLASIYPDNMAYTVIIIFVALLMLGVMLRVTSQVFFGPANAEYREKRGWLYYLSLAVSILVIFNGVLSQPLVSLLSYLLGVPVQ